MLQTKHIESLLHCFDLEDCRPIVAPMETGLHLSVHDAGEYFDAVLYQQAFGCLIYVCIKRPDIQYAMSQVSRFMHSPGISHWQVVKRTFRYLSGTQHLKLFYPKGGIVAPDMHDFSNFNSI